MVDSPPLDEEWDDNDDEMHYQDSGDEDEDADEDEDEIARRLGAKLWADISAAQAALAGNSTTTSQPAPSLTSQTSRFEKAQAAIVTMKSILAILDADPFAKNVLRQACLPDSPGQNVLDLLTGAVATGTIFDGIALPLSTVLRSLSQSDALTLVTGNEFSVPNHKGKRKRDEFEENTRTSKRVGLDSQDLQTQVSAAIHLVGETLGANPDLPLDASTISPIQMPLYQIYLFAVTASSIIGPQSNALQELSGLIQVIGVISGVQITAPAPASSPIVDSVADNPQAPLTWHPSGQSRLSDIGTAVYPCLAPGCAKTFSRLFSLRTHRQRSHTNDKSLQCETCSVTFTSHQDLRKHAKGHAKKAWQCMGCQKIFARKDGIKRHLKTAETRKDKEKGLKCAGANIEEVDAPEQSDQTKKTEEAASSADEVLEDGEIPQDIISLTQNAVLELQTLLSERVANALGKRQPNTDAINGQATLASVIARAQSSNTDSDALKEAHVTSSGSIATTATPSLSLYGLSEEQAKMLQAAVASAADAAKAQAEAEAELEEDDDSQSYEDEEGNEFTDS